MQKRLTEASVAKIKPDPARRIEIQDQALPGLRLRVSPSGRKSWSFMYKVAGEAVDGSRGKNRRMTLGIYPLIGLKAARTQAGEAKDMADRGVDPAAHKRGKVLSRVERQIDRLIPKFIELYAKPHTKKWRGTDVLLSTTVGEMWRGKDVTKIKRADVHALLDDVSEAEGVSKAREVRKHLSVLLNWAVDRGICEFNPMAGMKRKDLRYQPRATVLSIEVLRQIWEAAEKIGYPFGPIVKLLILSGQRRSEIANLRRGWVTEDFIEIPSEFYKTRRHHVIPLTMKMREIIEAQPIWNEGDFVFSTTGGRTPSSGFSRAKQILDRETGLSDWTLHDIRRSVATHMAQQGVLQEHIERVLGHAIPGIAGTYNRYSYLAEKTAAFSVWERAFMR